MKNLGTDFEPRFVAESANSQRELEEFTYVFAPICGTIFDSSSLEMCLDFFGSVDLMHPT